MDDEIIHEVYHVSLEDSKRLTTVEAHLETITKDIDSLKSDVSEMKKQINDIQDKAGNAALHAWKWIGGMVGAALIGGLISILGGYFAGR